ncbi:hypothetical protein [Sphaerisporangium aureirubrum]|uniref:Alpha/beta hydrolase n=1 Tax=Sphaerisporangium aureirubrum TaxID=1544736 RepID=A0ABW1N9V2_9ACTN
MLKTITLPTKVSDVPLGLRSGSPCHSRREESFHRPAIVGHSFGGVIAAWQGGEHPECPLTANLDVQGNLTRLEQFLGLDEVLAVRAWQGIDSFLIELRQGLPVISSGHA